MRRYCSSEIVAGFLLIVAVACGPPTPDEEPAVSPSPTVTVAAPTALPPPTLPSLATPITLETPTVGAPPTPTQLLLPEGWKLVGSEAVGLQLAVPRNWLDVRSLPEAHQSPNPLGPHSLIFADSESTARTLLVGDILADGAFVVGLVTDSLRQPDWLTGNPAQAVQALIDSNGNEPYNQPISTISSRNAPQLKGAYTDLNYDPLGIVPVPTAGLRLRLIVFTTTDSPTTVVLLLATAAADWSRHNKTFTLMAETVILHNVEVATVLGALHSGDTVSGRLGKGATDLWAFQAVSGQYATITVSPLDSRIDLTLALIDAAGRTLEGVDNGYAGDKEVLADVLLRQTDVFFIEVKEFFDEAGPYELSLVLTDAPQFGGGGRLAIGEQISGHLPSGARHQWSFSGTAGQTITIVVTPLEPQWDVTLGLLGPDGQPATRPLDEGFSGDPELLVGFTLPITGDYTILVYGFADHGGRYTLSLDEGGESTINFWEAGDLAYGDTKREVLRANEAHAWYFDGRGGDEVTIVVTPLQSRLDMDVWLLDPNVHKLVMKDEFLSGIRETIEFTLPADGQYIILVREFFGEAGPYEIALSASGRNFIESMGALTWGQPVNSSLPPGKRAEWHFSGQRGQTINIDLAPLTAGADLMIVLQAPDGSTAVIVDETLAGVAERLHAFSLTASGQWTILVQEFFDAGAEYTLLVTQ